MAEFNVHYARKKDTLKSTFYAQQILKTINTTKKLLPFETTIVTATMKFYANLIASRDKVEALSLIDKAMTFTAVLQINPNTLRKSLFY